MCKNPSVTALGNIREYYKMQSTGIGGIVSIGDGLMPGMPLAKLDGSNYYSHFLLSKEVGVKGLSMLTLTKEIVTEPSFKI